MVPLWFLVWESLSPHSSFKIPPLGAWIASTILFYVFGVIPAGLTGLVSGALYSKLKLKNKWLTMLVTILVTVIAGCVLSALLVYCISSMLFSSEYNEPFKLAELAALMGFFSSLFCSLLVAYLFIKGKLNS